MIFFVLFLKFESKTETRLKLDLKCLDIAPL